jgi:hypothetical protein
MSRRPRNHPTRRPKGNRPTVRVHTTIPVHEVHYNEAKHHAIYALPAATMVEFKAQDGALGGREERSDAFAGEPRAVGSTLGEGGNHTIGGPGTAGTTSVTDGNMRDGDVRDGDMTYTKYRTPTPRGPPKIVWTSMWS